MTISYVHTFSENGISAVAIAMEGAHPQIIPAIHQCLADHRWKGDLDGRLMMLAGGYYKLTEGQTFTDAELVNHESADLHLLEAIRGKTGQLCSITTENGLWLVPLLATSERVLHVRIESNGPHLTLHDLHDQRQPLEVEWQDVVEQTTGKWSLFYSIFVEQEWDSLEELVARSKAARMPAALGAW
jgi:hypothetical protein